MRMRFLIWRAYLKLIFFDLYLLRGNFDALHKKVRRYPIRKGPLAPDATGQICTAVDMACIWYCKEVLCLQRSAATACLLKQFGVAAEMIIGVQQLPFRSHAWVEVDGKVVSDKPYMREMYSVLDQC
jgi:hypothetical protein